MISQKKAPDFLIRRSRERMSIIKSRQVSSQVLKTHLGTRKPHKVKIQMLKEYTHTKLRH